MNLDVDALRAATPGCAQRVHLNNAGAALMSQRTLDVVVAHLRREADIGGYEAADEVSGRLDATRAAAAELIGARPDEVALTGSDTDAWTKAFWGFVLAGGFDRHRRVVVDLGVYNSHHLAILQAASRWALEVVVLPAGTDGPIDLGALERALEDTPGLLTITHVPTHSGTVAPAASIGRLASAAGVPYFLDACQSAGQLQLDVTEVGCQVATMTGRKWLRAPRGTGVLYVQRDALDRFDPPGIDASSAAWSVEGDDYQLAPGAARFEEFECSIAARLGLGNAIEELLALGPARVEQRIAQLAAHLRSRLVERAGVRCTDMGDELSGIVTFVVDGTSADDVAARVGRAGINVSVSRAENSRVEFSARGLDTVVRASPHVYNTVDELDRLVDALDGRTAPR